MDGAGGFWKGATETDPEMWLRTQKGGASETVSAQAKKGKPSWHPDWARGWEAIWGELEGEAYWVQGD